jgi:hypothetical protein
MGTIWFLGFGVVSGSFIGHSATSKTVLITADRSGKDWD